MRFTLSEKLQAVNVHLHTNYPAPGQAFVRQHFRALNLYVVSINLGPRLLPATFEY